MRVGSNPAKQSRDVPGIGRHRVIVPVYLPNFDGYFEHGLDVLALCLESLRLTTHGRAALTIVSNGCATEVVDRLHEWFAAGWFDQLVVNRTNRGKVDAVVSVARGVFEPFVTVSDCDVLFKHGWLQAIDDVFDAFPEAGFVSPFPAAGFHWHHTTATLLGAMPRGELHFANVADAAALNRFGQSIGHPEWVAPEYRRAQLTVARNGATACVGAGHFIGTLRREVIAGMPSRPSLVAVGGNSEAEWFDVPPDRLGFWRLSTPVAWVSHMGNKPEPWMARELADLVGAAPEQHEQSSPRSVTAAKRRWARLVPLRVRRRVVRAMRSAPLRRILYRRWGYPESDIAGSAATPETKPVASPRRS